MKRSSVFLNGAAIFEEWFGIKLLENELRFEIQINAAVQKACMQCAVQKYNLHMGV